MLENTLPSGWPDSVLPIWVRLGPARALSKNPDSLSRSRPALFLVKTLKLSRDALSDRKLSKPVKRPRGLSFPRHFNAELSVLKSTSSVVPPLRVKRRRFHVMHGHCAGLKSFTQKQTFWLSTRDKI